jgi:predicted ArsR family transcriptional regulator
LIKTNAIAYAALVRALQTQPRTAPELAQACGLHYVCVLDHLRALHRAGAVCVAGWTGEGNAMKAMWAISTATQSRDIERPPPLTRAERAARYRARRARTINLEQRT